MSDPYQAGDWSPAAYGSEVNATTYPPRIILYAVGIVLVLDAALFLVGGKASNWLGYALGAFGTSTLIIVYRAVDLKRRRNPMYVRQPKVAALSTGLLFVGIALASVHVFFALQTSELA